MHTHVWLPISFVHTALASQGGVPARHSLMSTQVSEPAVNVPLEHEAAVPEASYPDAHDREHTSPSATVSPFAHAVAPSVSV